MTQLIETVDHFPVAIDALQQVDLICTNLANSFDEVAHIKLIFKPPIVWIDEILVHRMKEYFTDPRQIVSLNGCFPNPLKVISGVPQGSVLGPLLFLLHINDILV